MVSTHHHTLDSLILEPGAVQHLDAIMRIEESSFSAPWTRRMFEVELTDNPFARFLTAHIGCADQPSERSRNLVGYVCFWVVFEELRMMNLAVALHVRHRRIGRWLLQQALTMGREQGARRALLEVRVSNNPAVALYEHAGFSRSGVRTKYYTNPIEDAVLMELDL
ncbi:MAG: ribosomal protein S18-alanine N-acetyltransferase [Nitrospirota bacterium]|nr:ribosomal protein S18-alanine N-acetyltransferase [Nitrospirota bacterium]